MAQAKNLAAIPARSKTGENSSRSLSWVIENGPPDAATSSELPHVCGLPTDLEAQQFCEHHDLEDTIHQAVDLITASYRSASDLKLYKETDPDIGESWLVIDFCVQGDLDQIEEEDEIFTQKWVATMPRDKDGLVHDLVRIGFDILS